MKPIKIKGLILSAVAIAALSLAVLGNAPRNLYNGESAFAPQDTVSAPQAKHRVKQQAGTTNQYSTGNEGGDLNNAGSPAQERHERTGSLNPYSYGSVKSHEGNKGATGVTGNTGK